MKKWTVEEDRFLREQAGRMTTRQLAEHFGVSVDSINHKFSKLGIKRQVIVSTEEQIAHDRARFEEKSDSKLTTKKYKLVLAENEMLRKEITAVGKIQETHQSLIIKPSKSVGSEATIVVVASDWHSEETVRPEQVSGLNTFNLKIADSRISNMFRNSTKLALGAQRDSHIKEMVLCLLGDFISGSIHEELVEGNSLLPIDAIIFAEQRIIAGINYYLANTNLNLTIVCHVGNHSRITQKTHIATEQGNSLEFYMYHHLANLFASNKRVKFVIAQGYHSYLDIYGFVIRTHHGHSIQYGGGVGGIYIAVNKAIAQWNKGRRADLDVFAHFHQLLFGANFVCNGSLIGYNSYALKIKADCESAKQAFFLVDKNHGKTLQSQIWLD